MNSTFGPLARAACANAGTEGSAATDITTTRQSRRPSAVRVDFKGASEPERMNHSTHCGQTPECSRAAGRAAGWRTGLASRTCTSRGLPGGTELLRTATAHKGWDGWGSQSGSEASLRTGGLTGEVDRLVAAILPEDVVRTP